LLHPAEPETVPSSEKVAVIVVPGMTFEAPVAASAEIRVQVPRSDEGMVTAGVVSGGVAGVVVGGTAC
jgi:hypothetical protein